MNQDSEVKKRTLHCRLYPALVGFVFGAVVLAVTGSTVTSVWFGWAALSIGLLALLVSFIGIMVVPKLAVSFRSGIAFLLSAFLGAFAIAAFVATLTFASFDTQYASGYSDKAFKKVQLGE